MFVVLMFCLNLLKSQPLVSVGQINDAAVSEAVLLQDVLQDVVVLMGVGAQVVHLFVAPLQAGVRHALHAPVLASRWMTPEATCCPPIPLHEYACK